MLNVNYIPTTGEIVSYSESLHAPSLHEIPDGLKQIRTKDNIFDKSGNVVKKIRLRDEALVPHPPSLLGHRRCNVLKEKSSLVPKGMFVEVGVYKGGTAWHLLEVANQQKRKFHVFDTFTGIPKKGELDLNNVGDFGDVDLDEVKELLPEAIFHVGLFPDTMTDDVKDVAFVHMDGDIYFTTKAFKTHLWDKMVFGGMAYFDDCDLRGVSQALKEDFGDKVQYDSNLSMCYLVKS